MKLLLTAALTAALLAGCGGSSGGAQIEPDDATAAPDAVALKGLKGTLVASVFLPDMGVVSGPHKYYFTKNPSYSLQDARYYISGNRVSDGKQIWCFAPVDRGMGFVCWSDYDGIRYEAMPLDINDSQINGMYFIHDRQLEANAYAAWSYSIGDQTSFFRVYGLSGRHYPGELR